MAIYSAGARRNTAPHARSAAESPESLSREADEICNGSLLRRDSVDGQYVAQLPENAVKSQNWVAVSVYVLVAIVRKRLKLEASLYTLLQILSVTVFEKMPIQQAFDASHFEPRPPDTANQLNLFAT
jgi:hypothetical protein